MDRDSNRSSCKKKSQGRNSEEFKHRMGKSKNYRGLLKRIKYFFMAPLVKFIYHTLSFAVFLVLLSYTLLIGFYKEELESIEVTLGIWMVGFLFEEFAEILSEISSPQELSYSEVKSSDNSLFI